MNRKLWFALLLALAASLLVAYAALAQDPPAPRPVSDDEVNAVAKQLYCPVCENIPLDVCPTQACSEWRDLIRLKLSEGSTPQEIKDYFVAQYGDRVLATPPARGLNWLVYVLPPLAILSGGFILYRALRAWKKPVPTGNVPQEAEAPKDEYIRRMEEELRKM